jgi:ABC-type lipoprotein export system ATPase subunit
MSLELRQVTHRYPGGNAPVLRDVSYTFPPNGSIAIVGPLTRPAEGAVLIDGQPVTQRDAAELRTRLFAWVFQTVNVLNARTVTENAMLGLLARGVRRRNARALATEALATVGLGDFGDRTAHSLSGGELQRLCIARAIAAQPRFLLADEPTGQLDRATTDRVTRALIDGRPAGTTLIVVTHDHHVAQQCDRTLTIRDGVLLPGDSG